MKSQTSFFNYAIFINNIKRFSFVGILFACIHFLVTPLSIALDRYLYNYRQTSGLLYQLTIPNGWDMFVIFTLPIFISLMLYRYIQDERSLSIIHAMPVTRKSLFITHYISFIVIYFIPIVLNSVIIFFLLLGKGYLHYQVIIELLIYMLIMLVAGTAIFSLSLVFGFLVGSSVLQTVLVYIWMITPYGLYHLFNQVASWLVKGYPYQSIQDPVFFLSPYVTVAKFFTNVGSDTWIGIITFVAYVGVMSVLAYWLYMKRDLEKHHDFIAFNQAKEAFVYILTTLVTLLIAIYIGEMLERRPMGIYLGVLIGSLLGMAITKMIAYKTIKVLRYYKSWLFYFVIVLVGFIVLDNGMVGYENRVPRVDEVEYVIISEGYRGITSKDIRLIDSQSLEMDPYEPIVKLSRKESLNTVISIHEGLIGVEDHYAMDNEYRNQQGEIFKKLTLYYVLKSGKTLHRSYEVWMPYTFVKDFKEIAEYKEARINQVDLILGTKEKVSLSLRNLFYEEVPLTENDYRNFLEAFKVDFMKMTYEEELSYWQSGSFMISYELGNDTSYLSYREFSIFPSYENTRQWLEEKGLVDQFFMSEKNVVSMRLIDRTSLENEAIDYARAVNEKMGMVSNEGRVTSDEELIRLALSLKPGYGSINYEIQYDMTNGQTQFRSYQTLPDTLLAILKQSNN